MVARGAALLTMFLCFHCDPYPRGRALPNFAALLESRPCTRRTFGLREAESKRMMSGWYRFLRGAGILAGLVDLLWGSSVPRGMAS